jgi:hypothetical protein
LKKGLVWVVELAQQMGVLGLEDPELVLLLHTLDHN